jgi:hypothetical protein
MKKKMPKKKHPLYTRWNGMIARCYYKSHSHYKYYGAKGVTVCDRWRNEFWNFVEDVENRLENGHLLYDSNYQLDKDLKGGNIYSLETCCVIPKEINNKLSYEKKQKEVLAIFNNETKTFKSLSETCDKLNISRQTIASCIWRNSKHKTGYYFKYSS